MKRREIKSFEEAVAYLYETPRFTRKNTIEDTRAFLHGLGNPDQSMKIIHVAGTNGKGSVCAYLRNILEAAGLHTALFTSPHLVDIRERFLIDGEMISKEVFLEGFLSIYNRLDWESLEREEDAYHPTFFEFLFFIAMVIFPKHKIDFLILETGLGGRLDATNAVAKKEVSVITHISLDHVEYLGDTPEKIAWEKAGIMQKGTPAVFWETSESVGDVFRESAKALGIPAFPVSREDFCFRKFREKGIDFSLYSEYYGSGSLKNLHIPTVALYQMENASLAVRTVQVLNDCVSKDAQIGWEEMACGLQRTFWSGRMEEVCPDVFVDGAHNEDGVRAFLESVAADGHEGKRTLLFGAVREKDVTRMVGEIIASGLFQKFAITRMETGRTLETDALEALFRNVPGCRLERFDNSAAAYEALLRKREDNERIYIAGSLYLVGEIKGLLE